MKPIITFLLLITACAVHAQQPDRQQFIRTEAPVVALTHVRIIDGTGTAPIDDQTIVIAGGKITVISPSATAKVEPTAQI
ncbi:MAG TPA: amidohydrolase, partial [Blastocatellia bacterium]|nr:amidohydrolase [Blastocatellia bacterium]